MRRPSWLVFILAITSACTSSAPAGGVRELTFLHTSDLHARLSPDDEGRGGFATMAAAIAEHKAEAKHRTLTLHAGDFVQGAPVSTIFRGMPAYEVGNLLGFDVHTLGNHEFDYGWERTLEFVEAGDFETISANVVNQAGETMVEPTANFTINGVRIGVIGLVTERLADLTMASIRGPWNALPVVETARRYSERLEPDTDLILVLAHCFDDEDEAILRGAPLVDLVIGGHNHGGQQEVKEIDGRLIVKVRSYGRELGRLDVDFDVDEERIVGFEWRRIQVTTKAFAPDAATERLVNEWEAKVSGIVDQPIGRSAARLGRDELQSLLEQVMRDATGADLAYQNSGGIRDSLPRGEVSRRHVWNILPFGNDIVYGSVRGAKLPQELLERGLRLDPRREYVVATNSFIAAKWRERGIELNQVGPVLREETIRWIEAQRVVP